MNVQETTQKGFTLLETLVAILILTLSVTAATAIAQKSLQTAVYSQDETTAYYLAAESIELVKNIRDTNGTAWLGTLTTSCQSACDIHPTNTTEIAPGFAGAQSAQTIQVDAASYTVFPIAINPSNSIYGFQDSNFSKPTKFFRSLKVVQVSPANPDGEAQITVDVVWKTGAFSYRKIELQEIILNWRS